MTALGQIYFYFCAAFALLGAIWSMTARNPIRGALGLMVMILAIAGLFLSLDAQFIAAIQLIVYAGAVVVLFVFVIMLLGPDATGPRDTRGLVTRIVGGGLFALAALGALALLASTAKLPAKLPAAPSDFGGIDAFGREMFTSALAPFELSSALLLVSVLGAIAVARGKGNEKAEARLEHRPETPTETAR
jgi:NADH-quinone oxidoreductase subunit J